MVSVLMCTYNRENYLKRAIESVLNQTYKELEFIIIDDGSTDHSRELIEAFDDTRIQYYYLPENQYYCYAANYGMQFCNGEYIAIINSDDEWLPEKLEKQIKFLETNQMYGACFSEVTLIDNEGNDVSEQCQDMQRLFANHYETQEEWMEFFLFYGNSLCHPSAVIRKELLDKVGGFNLMFSQLADFDLWVRIVMETPIYVMPERLIKFRWDIKKKNQISSNTKKHAIRSFNEQILIRKQMIEQLTDEQFVRFYRKNFKNALSNTPLELEFERAFLLMECTTEVPGLKVLGINKIEQVLRHTDAISVLKNHFGLTVQDIYEWNQDHWYMDYIVVGEIAEQKEKIAQQQQCIQEQEVELEKQKNLIEAYENSTSWKCTAPLRNIMRRIKTHGLRR